MAAGGFWSSLAHSFLVSSDPVKLSSLGFQLRPPPSLASTLTADHCLVQTENAWAHLVMDLSFAIVPHRGSSMMWHYAALPGKWALLVSSDERQVKKTLDHTKVLWRSWDEAKSRTEATVKE